MNSKRHLKPRKRSLLHKMWSFSIKTIGIVLLLLFLIIIFIRSPWGQGVIVEQAISYVSNKTQTKIDIEKLFITFSGKVQLKGLYIEDTERDTLLYSRELLVNLPLLDIIKGEKLAINSLSLDGLKANIIRLEQDSRFNFQFIIDAFKKPSAVKTDVKPEKLKDQNIPLKLDLGDLSLNNIDIKYYDEITGVDGNIEIGDLLTNINKLDLETLDMEVNGLHLQNAKIKLALQEVQKEEVKSSSSTKPNIRLNDIKFDNVNIDFESEKAALDLDANIHSFALDAPMIDLNNSRYQVDEIKLHDSKIQVKTFSDKVKLPKVKGESTAFEWPDLYAEVDLFDLARNELSYISDDAQGQKGKFNADAIQLQDLDLRIEDLKLADNKLNLSLKKVKALEYSGLDLSSLVGQIDISDDQLKITKFHTLLNQSLIDAEFLINYPKLALFIQNPEIAYINARISELDLNLEDVYFFSPLLKDNPTFATLAEESIQGNLSLDGKLNDQLNADLIIDWAETKVQAKGLATQVLDKDSLYFDFPHVIASTTRNDILQFVNEDSLNLQFPDQLQVTGHAEGTLKDIETNLQLETSQGKVGLVATFINKEKIKLNSSIIIEEYNLDELLIQPDLGQLSLAIHVKSEGNSLQSLNGEIDGEILNFEFKKYPIKGLSMSGDIVNSKANIVVDYKDQNIAASISGSGTYIDSTLTAGVNIVLDYADLKELGVGQKRYKTGLNLQANFVGNLKDFNAQVDIKEGHLQYEGKEYDLGDFYAKAFVHYDSTTIDIKNKLLNLDLSSNAHPDTIYVALKNQFNTYFFKKQTKTRLGPSVKLSLNGNIHADPLFEDVFKLELNPQKPVSIAVDYIEDEKTFLSNIIVPTLSYQGSKIDSFAFNIKSDAQDFAFDFGFNEVTTGPLIIPPTTISGVQTLDGFKINFNAHDQDTLITNVDFLLSGNREKLDLSINPSKLILNEIPWHIPDLNQISYSDKSISFRDFNISHEEHKIEITNPVTEGIDDEIEIDFTKFDLSDFLSYLNLNTRLGAGLLTGQVNLQNPLVDLGILADISIDQFKLLDVDLGHLKLDANLLDKDIISIDGNLGGGDINLDLLGQYNKSNKNDPIDVDLDIERLNMRAISVYSKGAIKDAEGFISGNLEIHGKPLNPIYQGEFDFNEIKFKITETDQFYTLNDENISIDNEGIAIEEFTILDENNHTFIVDGVISTETLSNPAFFLTAKADQFQLLDATKEQSESLYGKAVLDANINIGGDLNLPKIDMTLTAREEIDLHYLVTDAKANYEPRDDILVFVDKKAISLDTLLPPEEEIVVKGLDITARINIDRKAKVAVVMDQETDIYFDISGMGELLFNLEPNGEMNLLGRFNTEAGKLIVDMYNLVDRKFEVVKGSTVDWTGDPLEAALNIKAVYEIEASASGLMESVLSDEDNLLKEKFKQVLPFYVYLIIGGDMSKPEISFSLDMPEDSRGAVDGQVYDRVQRLNTQEEELSKQVFSLLVLDRFYPTGNSDGSAGNLNAIARNNINDAISSQLNVFSNKLLAEKGLDLNFDLNSFTDYQGVSEEDRTKLNIDAQTKIFDDRLIVKVGSEIDIEGSNATGEQAPLVGNVSIEYLLSEDGNYKIKGFKENEFENVIDGQTVTTGVALSISKDFNKFGEFWNSLFKRKKNTDKLNKE